MAAAKYDLTIEQGATFLRTITLKDSGGTEIDLTGWSIRGQIRVKQGAGSPLATFTGTILDQVSATGQATISLTAAQTSALPVPEGSPGVRVNSAYLYDVEMVRPDTSVLRVLQGLATVVPEITR